LLIGTLFRRDTAPTTKPIAHMAQRAR
jgi:hypothetical protein